MPDLPPLNFGNDSEDASEMLRHLRAAMEAHARRDPRGAAASLAAAEMAAKQANLLRQAAKIRKAMTLLAQGQVPRLLLRDGYLERERD
jgi:hypothetical protein